MRRKIAIGTLGLLILLAAAIVGWAQQGDPQGPGPGQGQHQMWGGGEHQMGGPASIGLRVASAASSAGKDGVGRAGTAWA